MNEVVMSHPATEDTIGVLIVDDHDLYRTLAVEVVEASDGFDVVATASDRDSALRCMVEQGPDVGLVLMDVNLGGDDGVQLTREIAADDGELDIVLVTALSLDDLPLDARRCGARGYLPKAELSPRALRQVRCGVYDWSDGDAAGSSS